VSKPANHAGVELLARGCHQGALIEAPARMLRLCSPGDGAQGWAVADDTAQEGQLAVVSQDCDIAAPVVTEPCVEAVTARWSSSPSEIHIARKGNSVRLYLLGQTGQKALLADARRRIHIEKEALLAARFTDVLPDELARRRFASWVAGRYDRPAIENELIDAIHKPLVKATDLAIRTSGDLSTILERVSELRFSVFPESGNSRWTVGFVAMLEEGDELKAEEEGELAGWLERVLVHQDGPIEEIRIVVRTPRTISVQDYLSTKHLQLDHYTLDQ